MVMRDESIDYYIYFSNGKDGQRYGHHVWINEQHKSYVKKFSKVVRSIKTIAEIYDVNVFGKHLNKHKINKLKSLEHVIYENL